MPGTPQQQDVLGYPALFSLRPPPGQGRDALAESSPVLTSWDVPFATGDLSTLITADRAFPRAGDV